MNHFPQLPPAYTFQKELERGFLSRTAVVIHQGLAKLCICKVLEISKFPNRQVCESFVNSVKDTMNIKSRFFLPFSEALISDNYIYLIRDYLDMPTLEEQVINDTKPNMNSYYVLWKTIVHTVRKFHAANIAPNFIRPSNIYIKPDGTPLITDIYPPMFNAANPQCAKKLIFLAPEFLKGENPGKEADSWSIGLLLLFMITGESPWNTKNLMRMMQDILKGVNGLAIEVPAPLKPIIDATVNPDPSKRLPLTSLGQFNPMVSTITRKNLNGKPAGSGTKLSKTNINAQQSVLTLTPFNVSQKKQISPGKSMSNIQLPSFFDSNFKDLL